MKVLRLLLCVAAMASGSAHAQALPPPVPAVESWGWTGAVEPAPAYFVIDGGLWLSLLPDDVCQPPRVALSSGCWAELAPVFKPPCGPGLGEMGGRCFAPLRAD